MKRKTILGDFALNLLASLVTTGVAQLLVYPLLSSMYSAEEYGIILTVMGITNTGIVTIGGSLNNVRLMVNADYEAENQRGDFLPILWGLSLVTALLFAAYLSKFYAFGYALVAALVLFLIAGILRSYGTVSFRLVINYKVNLICSCAVAVGNVLGILLLRIPRFEDIWALPFLLGEVMGVLVILDRSRILCEPIRKTLFFKSTCRKEAILLSTTLSANILTYLDRLLLLPLLGGEAVAHYTVASFFGKSLSILMTPIASVLLSYYAQKDFKMSRSVFWKINGWTLLTGAAFMLVCVFFGRWGTGLFYPSLIDDAAPYLLTANLSAILVVISNMTQPAVLKFAPTYCQLIVQGSYCIFYLAGGILGARAMGLMGFAIASLIASLVRVILLYAIGHIALGEKVR